MKTVDLFKRVAAAFVAALTFAACSTVQPDYPEPAEAQPAVFIIGDPGTRALLGSDEHGHFGQWLTGDKMGTFVTSSSGTGYGYSVITPGNPATVAVYSGSTYKTFKGGEVVRAYYPSSNSASYNSVEMAIPAAQTQSGSDFNFDAMPMVSGQYTIPVALDKSTYPVVGELILANLASVAEFRVFSSNPEYVDEIVTKVTFDANASIAGSFTKSIASTDPYDPSTLEISGYTETSVSTTVSNSLDLGSSLDNAYSIFMVVAPGTYGGSITVTTDKATYRFPLKSSQTFKRSVVRSLGVDLGTCTDRTAISNAGLVTVTKTVKEILTAMGMGSTINGTVVNPLTVDDVITMSTTGSGNNAKVYGSASEWRLYTSGNGNLIISAANGYELRSVTITHTKTSSSAANYNFGGPASGVAQSVSGKSVSFSLISGNMSVKGISVSYVPVDGGPSVSTGGAKNIGSYSATLTATYKDVDVSKAPQDKGFYWGTSPLALTNELYDNENLVTTSSGSYETLLHPLQANTTYYYQAFMTVWKDGSYQTITGDVMSFTTTEASAFGTAYLSCYEMPEVVTTVASTGPETFGTTAWYAFQTNVSTRMVVTHTYRYNNKIYRNYTACVDQTKRCPVWTAYVMHGGAYPNNDVKRSSFSELTSYDPAIPASWQSSGSTSDYNNGEGYARGHHCASEDRQACRDANDQTFYYTNQSPQWQNGFNSGVWATLEGAVQSRASSLSASDTLYVVVGTLFEDGNTGSSNDGGTVARPSHFYKLLMMCHFDGSGNVTSASTSAWIFENKANTGGYSDSKFKTTVDAIETRTGFNFFANVPSEIQEAAESAFSDIL